MEIVETSGVNEKRGLGVVWGGDTNRKDEVEGEEMKRILGETTVLGAHF